MKIAVLAEQRERESRVACVPEAVRKYLQASCEVAVEAGAGGAAGFSDAAYSDAGARVAAGLDETLHGAEAVLAVRAPESSSIARMPRGANLFCLMAPHRNQDLIAACAAAGVDAFAMELMPRITRAQSMDVLSSQSNLAGYRSVIEAAAVYGRVMPMMMTAAGTVAPARVFVMGAGVAGLQAIATARRLGAVVTSTDVRPAAKEQVASLGAEFVAVEDDEFRAAETAGGYAKEMSAEYRAKQAELVASHIPRQDMVITTALIPGRPAPQLLDEAMVRSMKPGSVVVDMAVEEGGNCALSRADEIVDADGVKVVGYSNLAGRVPGDASTLYARNLYNFIQPMVDGDSGALRPDGEDELVKGTRLTHGGAVVHPNYAKES